jgi:malonate decarboxylase beta subunit
MRISYAECSARERLQQLLDGGTFHEFLPPAQRVCSPHLARLNVPASFDDGIVIGSGQLGGRAVLVAAQEGGYLGGGVGEVHGAKLVGLLRRALRDRPAGVLLLADSGGVRLHEANAGLVAVSEVMRAVFDLRAAGVQVQVLVGGASGCFGGMGIVAGCADWRIISPTGRLGLSGPEVIETAYGVDEFDSRDRSLVWRTTGGKHRWITGDCETLVEDDCAAFRAAALAVLGMARPCTLERLLADQADLEGRLAAVSPAADPLTLWRAAGVSQAEQVPEWDVATLVAHRAPATQA